MRRALSLALALLCALPMDSLARVAIIAPSKCIACLTDEAEDRAQSKKILYQTVLSIMDKIGQPYDIIPATRAKTEWVRTGVFNTETGDKTYTAVIHLFMREYLSLANAQFGYRPDSLSLVNGAAGTDNNKLLVPQLFVGINGDWGPSGGRDSTGFAANLGGINSAAFTSYVPGTTHRWRSTNDEPESIVVTKAAGPYLREVVATRFNSFSFHGIGARGGTLRTNCVDCDSVFHPNSTTGSAAVWVTKVDVPSGGKGIIYTTNGHFWGLEFDAPTLMCGLALLDSMSDGGVFDSSKLPLQAAIQIRGGWRRGQRHLSGGISPNDSSQLKAAIDSIAALRAKVTVGVNVDSLSDYADDKNWWDRGAPYVRFGMEQWGGAVAGQPLSISTRGTTSWQRPLDPLGNARPRFIYGDGSAAGGDSSVWALVRANFYKMDSTFRRERVDRVLMGANFRWFPRSLTGRDSMGARADSLVAFLSDAGVRGAVTNSWWPLSNFADPSVEWPLSLNQLGGRHRITMGRSAGSYFNNWVTPGFVDSGSAYYNGNLVGGAGELVGNSFKKTNHFWYGLLANRQMSPYARMPYTATVDSTQYALGSPYTRIFTLHVGDLGSGAMDDWETRPSANGWWQIKSLVNASRAINHLANRTIVEFVWPDEIVK